MSSGRKHGSSLLVTQLALLWWGEQHSVSVGAKPGHVGPGAHVEEAMQGSHGGTARHVLAEARCSQRNSMAVRAWLGRARAWTAVAGSLAWRQSLRGDLRRQMNYGEGRV
jgi:hypothetical protein